MVDQPIYSSSINLRSKGIAFSLGKLHKGCVKDASSKLSIGSIPATYQAIIYRNQTKKAFGTSEKRFYMKEDTQKYLNTEKNDELDGNVALNISDVDTGMLKKDFNKEGSGVFVSKVKREWMKLMKTPPPTHYYQDKENSKQENGKLQKHKGGTDRKCQTRVLKHRTFQNKNNSKIKKISIDIPGPGHYLSEKKQFWKTTNKGWKSSFQTKAKRGTYISDKVGPGPGFYYKSFEEESKKKNVEKKNQEKCLKKQTYVFDMIEETDFQEPGPGWYNQDLPNFKPFYEKIKMTRNFMPPIYQGEKDEKKIGPGPGMYDVKRMYDDVKPKLIESNAFMSEAKRQIFQPTHTQGPNTISPEYPNSKNYHLNIKDEWLC